MTPAQKKQVQQLRRQGLSYTQVAEATGVVRNTIKSYLRREEIRQAKEEVRGVCSQCGKRLVQVPKMKPRRFCDEKCRDAYWNTHRCQMTRESTRIAVCACCGKTFDAHGKKERKYCSRECYVTARWGEVHE